MILEFFYCQFQILLFIALVLLWGLNLTLLKEESSLPLKAPMIDLLKDYCLILMSFLIHNREDYYQ